MTNEEWQAVKYFTKEEFNCKETGENNMQREFMEKLDELRELCGFPFVITSGYRSVHHSAETKKSTKGGVHTLGIAADIAVANGQARREIVVSAIKLGFGGIGVAKGFVHVDSRNSTPVMWTY